MVFNTGSYITRIKTSTKIIIIITRKHRQSYRHADPRRKRPQVAQRRIGIWYAQYGPCMVTSNRATVTFFVTVWPRPFDLWVNACRVTAIEYMCTKFVVDSSSQFPHKHRDRQTNKQTDATECRTHARRVINSDDSLSQCERLWFNLVYDELLTTVFLTWTIIGCCGKMHSGWRFVHKQFISVKDHNIVEH